jgi:hypothetical protein
LLLVLLIARGGTQESDCKEVVSFDSDQVVTFLSTGAHTASPECVTAAIRRAEELRAANAKDVLVTLLDFKRPETEREKMHISSLRDAFPAVPALFAIGKPAVPTIVTALRGEHLSDLARQNAIRALVLIYRDNPPDAISVLKKAETNLTSPAEGPRLQSAQRQAAKLCGKTWQAQCELALKTP